MRNEIQSGSTGSDRGDSNWSALRANWHEVKGKVQERWGKLTNDALDEIDGRREQLIAKVQKAYEIDEDQAAAEVDKFMTANQEYLNRGRDPNMPH